VSQVVEVFVWPSWRETNCTSQPWAIRIEAKVCRRQWNVTSSRFAFLRASWKRSSRAPLYEALSWAVSIDDRFQSLWAAARTNPAKWWSDGFAHGDTVRGLRYARNRVHHQWADALWLSHSGFSFPISFPLAFIEWRWRPELPPGRGEEFKAEYEQHVAASPARVTLGDLSVCFADALPVLAP
jgi:hypothetical protein